MFKKAISILLSILILSSSLFINAQTVYGIVNGSNVRMRSEANTTSQVVHKFVEENQKVIVFETVVGIEAEQGKGNTWYRIRTLDGQYEGYIYGVYITILLSTDEGTVPVNPNFEEQLAAFPPSYHAALRALHEAHPQWVFLADTLTMPFEAAVYAQYAQYEDVKKMVELSQGIAWRSLQKGQYDWSNNTWKMLDGNRWVAASREVIGYYMDPRNFLDETYIYMFMKQSYDSAHQTKEGLAKVINGTFLATGYSPNPNDATDAQYGGSYVEIIMAAAALSGISPYVIAAKIITEQGTSGSSALISGTHPGFENYYNFFNWGAYGSGNDAIITSGLTTAKEEGWDSRADSIIGGAKKLADGYVNAGQDTYFYMNFNLKNLNYYHQYAGSIYDAYVKTSKLARAYIGSFDAAPLVFNIPVYTAIPDAPATKPEKGDNRYNNYYILNIQAEGLSPSFDMYINNYNLSISESTTIYLTLPNTASLVSPTANLISRGDNLVKLTVKSETGYTDDYILNINSTADCTLTVMVGEPTTPPVAPPPANKLGDVNFDGRISLADIVFIKKHILGIESLTGTSFVGADINKDSKISLADLVAVKKHILGIEILE